MKHTIGPWKIAQINPGDVRSAVMSQEMDHIANVKLNQKTTSRSAQEANAHLIAAAPDLLEAMEELFKHCILVHKCWGEVCNQKEADHAITKAKAAIKKAKEGER